MASESPSIYRDGVRKIHPISDRYNQVQHRCIAGAYDKALVGPDTMFNCHNVLWWHTLRDHHGYQDLSSGKYCKVE